MIRPKYTNLAERKAHVRGLCVLNSMNSNGV